MKLQKNYLDAAIWRMFCHISKDPVRFDQFYMRLTLRNMIFVDILDIIVAYDRRTGKSLNVLDRYPEHYSGTVISRELLLNGLPDEEHLEMINIIIGGWNNYVRNQDRLTGLLSFKMEQSKLIGFNPIMVSLIVFYFYSFCQISIRDTRVYSQTHDLLTILVDVGGALIAWMESQT